MLTGGTATQSAYLLNQRILPALCNMLTVSDAHTIITVLDMIRILLKASYYGLCFVIVFYRQK